MKALKSESESFFFKTVFHNEQTENRQRRGYCPGDIKLKGRSAPGWKETVSGIHFLKCHKISRSHSGKVRMEKYAQLSEYSSDMLSGERKMEL